MATDASIDNNNNNNLKLALCQIKVTASKEANIANARRHLLEAAANGAQLAVLPECWNCPYNTKCFPEYAERLPEVGNVDEASDGNYYAESPSAKMLREVAVETGMVVIGGSVPEKHGPNNSLLYNTSLTYLASGELVAKHRKVHMFDVCVPGGISFRESETLSPGNALTNFNYKPDIGVGVGICYDVRFPELSMLSARVPGTKLLIFPGAFNMTTGPAHWELLLRARALDNQVYMAACSPARKHPDEKGYTAWGHSSVVDPWGSVVATTDEKQTIVYADIDLSKVELTRKAIPTSTQRRNDIYKLSKV